MEKTIPPPKTPVISTYNGWKKREKFCGFMARFLLFLLAIPAVVTLQPLYYIACFISKAAMGND